MTDDRAVSEVVGFILVFSIILGTISFVYVGGFTGLQDTRDHEQLANAERAFDVLANNFEDIGLNKAPSRATEIKLADARITVRDNGRMSINATSLATAATARPRPIVYDAGGDTQIVYENGAVIREDGDSAVMLREPDFIFNSERTVLRYIEPRGGSESVSGSTTVLVRAEESHSRLLASVAEPNTVTLNFSTTPNRAPVWESYFEAELDDLGGDCTINESGSDIAQIDCEFETNYLHVARSRLWVDVT
ncbi:hypothetical protein HWV07_04210 [Natronomonas salina]|uniref:DUF7289 family protein n=1 Tax=Natronomonas salina TaxID=1710540 RepID=UPI0015B48C8F|nr:hypothetical protein [Natronomonas salina]QLD88278.1 hypothetical protein HWV07_04210 [Natronomonas salina]